MGNQQDPHSTENYAIGKGILYIAEWNGDTAPESDDYEDIGNCSNIEVEPTTERLPHYSSRTDFRLKDKNPTTQRDYMVSFDSDEMASVNLNRFLMGSLNVTGAAAVIYALQGINKEYALKFVSDNPIGPNETWEFWKCTLNPNGAVQLIGEEWMVMSFQAEGLADVENHSASPYFTITYSSSSSSSSSSSLSSSSSSSSSSS